MCWILAEQTSVMNKGFVARQRHPGDGRAHLLRLTLKGQTTTADTSGIHNSNRSQAL